MKSELAELDLKRTMVDDEAPDAVPVPHALVPHLNETAILLDIDGTLLDLMPTPREVWVPPGLSETLNRLTERTSGALAMHYRLAPHAEKAIYEAVSLIRADLPNAPIEVLPGKFVCEIKHSGFTKASGVRELMTHEPFKGRRPIFIGDDVTDETVFAIMPDMNGLSFSVGRRAIGVDGHFDSPSDVREFLAHLLDDESAASSP